MYSLSALQKTFSLRLLCRAPAHVYVYIGLHRAMKGDVQGYVGLCRAMYGYVGLCMAMQGYKRLYVGVCKVKYGYEALCRAM